MNDRGRHALIVQRKHAGLATMLRGPALLFLCAFGCLPACTNDPAGRQVEALREENRQLQDQVRKQGEQLTAAGATIERQQQQIQVLQAFPRQSRLNLISTVASILLDDLTGGYDVDGKPGDDGVVVYLQPRDSDGDVIKAIGAIQLQLLDLANPPAQQVVSECRWSPEEARKVWYSRLLTRHFRLQCPWGPAGPPRHSSITARVIFNDVLTGQRFESQKVVEVRLPPPGPRAESSR